MTRKLWVNVAPGQVIVTLDEDECDEIVDCLDFARKNDLEMTLADKDFNYGVRKKMVHKAKKARRFRRELQNG